MILFKPWLEDKGFIWEAVEFDQDNARTVEIISQFGYCPFDFHLFDPLKEFLRETVFKRYVDMLLNKNQTKPMVRVFTNGSEDQGSIPIRIIPKTQKMVLDAALLNTQHYKGRIKGKVEQSKKRKRALPNTSVWKLLKKEPSGRLQLL